jgi:hypothetical protein
MKNLRKSRNSSNNRLTYYNYYNLFLNNMIYSYKRYSLLLLLLYKVLLPNRFLCIEYNRYELHISLSLSLSFIITIIEKYYIL